ncbi:MAG: transketolase [Bacillota bacterium]|nr:transketolase [Bacillota bacterium]
MIDIRFLNEKARQIRRDLLTTIYKAQAGHPGGSLSATDLLVALYYQVMTIDPKEPSRESRDRFILSKGHASALLYAILADKGYFDPDHLNRFRQISGILQGHPDMKKTPGVDMTTGSLGQGLSPGCGMAWAARKLGLSARVFVLLGDGELDEGQVWEALMFAAHHKLTNLVPIIDRNCLQLDGDTEAVLSLEPLADKLQAFGWKVHEIDGHDMSEIVSALSAAGNHDRLDIVIARTVKGKGVSFMEHQAGWHGQAPDAAEYKYAMIELGGEVS